MYDETQIKREDLELICRKGIGPVSYRKYLEYLNDPEFDKNAFESRFLLDEGLYNNVTRDSFEFVTYRSRSYPQLLAEAADSPVVLFYSGNLNLLQSGRTVGIAGTRSPTDYGISVCKDLVKAAQGDVVFVVGLALGIDTIIAQESLDSGAGIIGVLPANIRNIVPNSNRRLVDKILENNGLIVWENPLQEVTNGSFIQRNRIIAGLSNFLVIIEADEKSGSITTADFAFDYNRDVYAVPGKIYSSKSRGTNTLIKDNKAKILTKIQDLPGFGERNIDISLSESKVDKLELKLYYAILDEPKRLDDLLILISDYPILLSKLLNLEMLGYINKGHDGKYRVV